MVRKVQERGWEIASFVIIPRKTELEIKTSYLEIHREIKTDRRVLCSPLNTDKYRNE